jgi:PiT family inorganic phosphate transporter
MHLYGTPISLGYALVVALALLMALAFECANGFHDTANAVATVIYTNCMRPVAAGVWSGVGNLVGVLVSSGIVGFGVIELLPPDLVPTVSPAANAALVFAVLVPALAWNLGTWYLGLPVSSSHTLIGSLLGVGLANAFLSKQSLAQSVNYSQALSAGAALLVSPVLGLVCAAGLLLLARAAIRDKRIHTPTGDKAPPLWIRSLLLLSSLWVSFSHGSQDGGKGIGLILLILAGILPGAFAINMAVQPQETAGLARDARITSAVVGRHAGWTSAPVDRRAATQELQKYLAPGRHASSGAIYSALSSKISEITEALSGKKGLESLSMPKRVQLRGSIYLASSTINKLIEDKSVTDPAEVATLRAYQKRVAALTRFIPAWVKIAVALALGLGTMTGWRRIAVTVGEKIGRSPLTPAQATSAELVTAGTIAAANSFGIPASTTHVLSSAVAGSMLADRAGLQLQTVGKILWAWVLTIPATVLVSGLLYAMGEGLVRAAGL